MARRRGSSRSFQSGASFLDARRSLPRLSERLAVEAELDGLVQLPRGDYLESAHELTAPEAFEEYRSLPRAVRAAHYAKHPLRSLQRLAWNTQPLKSFFMLRPRRVAFCVRRFIRKEVLFAIRKAGFRGSGPGRDGRYRRTGDSAYRC